MRFWVQVCVAVCFMLGGAGNFVLAAMPTEERPVAILRALDKITARVEEIEVGTQAPYQFGTMVFTVQSCRVTPPEETPESAAFLEIKETKTGQEEKTVFSGWMFASSPALSAMEHPVYDLWLMGCKGFEEKIPEE